MTFLVSQVIKFAVQNQDYVIAASNYILNVGLNHNQLWDKLPLYFKNNRPFLDK